MTTAPDDRLDDEQRLREACVYAAIRLAAGTDYNSSDVIDLAEYLRSGDRPPTLPYYPPGAMTLPD
jgi:hypothetical protein